eukprot:1161539-Pelagomonas_calceolata.AAC.2
MEESVRMQEDLFRSECGRGAVTFCLSLSLHIEEGGWTSVRSTFMKLDSACALNPFFLLGPTGAWLSSCLIAFHAAATKCQEQRVCLRKLGVAAYVCTTSSSARSALQAAALKVHYKQQH